MQPFQTHRGFGTGIGPQTNETVQIFATPWNMATKKQPARLRNRECRLLLHYPYRFCFISRHAATTSAGSARIMKIAV